MKLSSTNHHCMQLQAAIHDFPLCCHTFNYTLPLSPNLLLSMKSINRLARKVQCNGTHHVKHFEKSVIQVLDHEKEHFSSSTGTFLQTFLVLVLLTNSKVFLLFLVLCRCKTMPKFIVYTQPLCTEIEHTEGLLALYCPSA